MPDSSVFNWKIAGEIRPDQQAVNKSAVLAICFFLAVIGLFFLFFQDSLVTAVFFFLTALVTGILAAKEKKALPWEISQKGFLVGRVFYNFSEIRSFWIEFDPPFLKELSFRLKKWHQSYVKIPLNREDPIVLRRYLLNFVMEEKHEDTIVEVFTRKLGI